MSYKVKPRLSFSENFERIAAEQIERAVACLQPDADVHKGVHEARKTMKRLRALLSLYRGALVTAERQDLDARFRDIGRALAGTRDIQAMLDSIALLQPSDGEEAPTSRRLPAGRRVLVALKTRIEGQHQSVETDRAEHLGRLSTLEADLKAAGEMLHGIRLERDGFEAIRPGLERTYRQARRLRVTAYAEGTAESFHEWRKALQRHWRHMQLLALAWPREMRTRAVATRAVAETVGQDHDLAMLDLHLAAHGRDLGPAGQVQACRRLCSQRQSELRASIEAEGEWLFAEGASAFVRRVERYWDLACERAGHPPRTAVEVS